MILNSMWSWITGIVNGLANDGDISLTISLTGRHIAITNSGQRIICIYQGKSDKIEIIAFIKNSFTHYILQNNFVN